MANPVERNPQYSNLSKFEQKYFQKLRILGPENHFRPLPIIKMTVPGVFPINIQFIKLYKSCEFMSTGLWKIGHHTVCCCFYSHYRVNRAEWRVNQTEIFSLNIMVIKISLFIQNFCYKVLTKENHWENFVNLVGENGKALTTNSNRRAFQVLTLLTFYMLLIKLWRLNNICKFGL